jgi:hypothetical protein
MIVCGLQLNMFVCAITSNFQFWRHDNKSIELSSDKVIQQKVVYIH